jgi:hypothetical protein
VRWNLKEAGCVEHTNPRANLFLESSTRYLEGKLKLTVNREKSRTGSVFAIRDFKFLGFALGRSGSGIYIRVHPKSWNMAANSRKGHWFNANLTTVKRAMTKERLISSGFYGLATAYQSVHVNY